MRLKFLFLTIFLYNFTFAQLHLDTLNWQSPLDIPLMLSGNFAELRSNHFHAGIDIKTQGKEGFKVYAAQKGYVSRIKVASGGYGKALYITHPDGYTSVYAHLKEYSIQIDRYVRKQQYKRQSFSVDLYLPKNKITVEKGEIIGLSGNTGSSGGPHLHFEIRETATEKPMNGLFLGFEIKDTIAPKMSHLYIYPYQKIKKTHSYESKIYSLIKYGKNYKLRYTDTLKTYGNEVAFGLKVDDFLNNSANRCGVYFLNMYVNGELYHQQEYDKFSFYETRYINSTMDYKENVKRKRKLYKLYKEPNNRVSLIKKAINKGVVKGNNYEIKHIKIEAIDVNNNKSELSFYVKFIPNNTDFEIDSTKTIELTWYKKNYIDTLNIKMEFDKGTFYDTALISVKEHNTNSENYFSPIYEIGDEIIPLHKYFTLQIPFTIQDSSLIDKLLIARIYKNKPISQGGKYSNGFIKTKTRNFGKYAVTIDTIPPTIKTLKMNNKQFVFKISDNLSGISNYRGTINGNWVLFEWDPKTRRLIYNADEYLPRIGTCTIKLEIFDNCGNKSVIEKGYNTGK